MAIFNEAYLVELFGRNKKKAAEAAPKAVKPSRKYGLFTEQEFNKCVAIIKKHTNKYPLIKENLSFDRGSCKTFEEYKKNNDDCTTIAFFIFGLDNIPSEKIDESDAQAHKCYDGIRKEFKELPFAVELKIIPDAEWDIICICSRKPLE